jgi:hypothetical protein
MLYDATPNEQFSVQLHHVGHELHPVIVIDDFLADPESLVRFASDEAHFGPPPSAYPGVIAPAPPTYVEALGCTLAALIASTFHVRPETAEVLTSFFGIVTVPPEQLEPVQQFPHVDSHNPAQLALLHYLCHGSHGGSAFFRHRATGFESLDSHRGSKVDQQMESVMANAEELPAGYIYSGNQTFEQTESFEMRFNRLLIYRSNVLHCGQISSDSGLSDDPRRGRLTINTFVQFAPV